MFDVIWTDPNTELVGERRARKEKKREEQKKQIQNRQQHQSEKNERPLTASQRSLSTRSSTTRSSVDSPFGFLRSKNKSRKTTASSALDTTPSVLNSPLHSNSGSHRRHRHSSSLLGDSSQGRQSDHARSSSQTQSEFSRDAAETASSVSSCDSRPILSRYNDTELTLELKDQATLPARDEATNMTRLVQNLGPDSFVTKCTQISWTPRNIDAALPSLLSQTSISSECEQDQSPQTPSKSPTKEPKMTPISKNKTSNNDALHRAIIHQLDSPIKLYPGMALPSAHSSPMWSIAFGPNNPDAWKPPDEWDRIEAEAAHRSKALVIQTTTSNTASDNVDSGLHVDFGTLQREVELMTMASHKVILSQLQDIWSNRVERSLSRAWELKETRLMLSALQNLDAPFLQDEPTWPLGDEAASPDTSTPKILALYESKATTSYLAALHVSKDIYHLSPSPLSPTLFPNIQPIPVPTITSSPFPLPPLLFSSVYSLSLPSQVPACDIPTILGNIHRCLKPQGHLQLTVVDPLPCAGTLGPLLRNWIEEHLLLNLERQFRCMNPSRLLPTWFAEANLRAKGSTVTSAKFYAISSIMQSSHSDDDDDDNHDDDDCPIAPTATKGSFKMTGEVCGTDTESKAEIRTLVGRMLWMQIWGGYITGRKDNKDESEAFTWWWTDESIVEECLELGTFWEYHVYKGVKGN